MKNRISGSPPPLATAPSAYPNLLKFTGPCPFSLPPEPRQGTLDQTASKIRILVAEDDECSRNLICARLEDWGYETVVTKNGFEAMGELRKSEAPSLAILDWTMPGMDGAEICRRVRDVNRPVYLIMLSSRVTKGDIVEGLHAGADDYLTKPFDKNELHARILAGLRVMARQNALGTRLTELEAAAGKAGEPDLQMAI
jgi:DNA-binding response OmpR family regulator